MSPVTKEFSPGGGQLARSAWFKQAAAQPLAWLGVIALVALADYLTGWEWSFGAVYMIPVLGVAYHLSRRWVLFVAIVCSLAWLAIDLHTNQGYIHPAAPYWNAFARLLMFGLAGLLLHQVRTLQSREKALMQFVVHDLRNPLTVLDLSLQKLALVQAGAEDLPAFKASKHLLRRSQGLLDALLELARLEVGARPLDLRPFPIAPVLDGVMDTFQFVQEHYGILIRIDDGGPDLQAVGDARLTERVLENVLGNAIKASTRGKSVTIRVSPPCEGYLQLSVADQGAGIPGGMRERVFEAFIQGGAEDGAPADGMGLGLRFCRVAVQAMRGRIWMECPSQGGTIVNIRLPAEA